MGFYLIICLLIFAILHGFFRKKVNMETLNVAILGCGTVGGGVAKIISEMNSELGDKAKKKIELKKTKQTVAMVVIANYRGLDKQKAQMIVLSEDSKEHEDIFITINGILH